MNLQDKCNMQITCLIDLRKGNDEMFISYYYRISYIGLALKGKFFGVMEN
jgi:hypothetical protein